MKKYLITLLLCWSASSWATSADDCSQYFPVDKNIAFSMANAKIYNGNKVDYDAMCRNGCQVARDTNCLRYSNLNKCCKQRELICEQMCHF